MGRGIRNKKKAAERFSRVAALSVITFAALTIIVFGLFFFQRTRARRHDSLRYASLKEYLAGARARMEEGDYQGAIGIYREIVSLAPANPEAHNMLGILHAKAGDADRALSSFGKAIALDIGAEKAYYNIGNLYLSQKNIDKAIWNYKRAISSREDYTAPRLMLARLYESMGRKKAAIKEYEEIFRVEKEYQKAILNDKTLTLEKRIECKNFFDVKNIYNTGFIQEKRGEYVKALEEYDLAIKLKPDFALAYLRRGIVCFQVKQYTKAEEDLKKALKIDPDICGSGWLTGDFSSGQGRTAETKVGMVKHSPDNVLVKDIIGSFHFREGNYQQAEKIFKEAIELDPEYGRAYAGLGTIYLRIGRYDESEKLLKKCIAISPDETDAYYNLACLYSLKGDPEESFKYLSESIEKGFKDIKHIKNDPDLENLRKDPLFKQIELSP